MNLINSTKVALMHQLKTSQLPCFTFFGDKKLDFMSGFPDIAARFGFTELLYGEGVKDKPEGKA